MKYIGGRALYEKTRAEKGKIYGRRKGAQGLTVWPLASS